MPILQTNITRTIWQTVRRITDEILGVKGLRLSYISYTFEQMHKTNFKTCTEWLDTDCMRAFVFIDGSSGL